MNRPMRLVLGILAVTLLAAGTSPATAQAMKIGVFDTQLVSESTQMGRQLQQQLAQFQTDKQQEIDSQAQEIQGLQEQLAQQGLSLSVDTRTNMQKNIQRRILLLQAARETATRELELELAAAKAIFEEKLFVAVESFGRDEGFSLILDRTLVAFAGNSIDVTSAIIDRFDKMFPVQQAGE